MTPALTPAKAGVQTRPNMQDSRFRRSTSLTALSLSKGGNNRPQMIFGGAT